MGFKLNKNNIILIACFFAIIAFTFSLYFTNNNIKQVEADSWNELANSESITGEGSISDPYVITTPQGLVFLNTLVCADTDTVLQIDGFETGSQFGICWSLGCDLDLGANLQWTPIGNQNSQYFSGNFNGEGFKITNMTINDTENSYLGLFGYCGSGIIKNLEISNSSVTGKNYVGLIAGYVVGAKIKNCYNSNSTITAEGNSGGIVGYALNCDINDCYNQSLVYGEAEYIGGLVGYASNTNLFNCYNNGSVTSTFGKTGGVVGCLTSGSICDSYNSSTINSHGHVGGLVGYALQSSVVRNYNKGNVISSSKCAGGLVGYDSGCDIENCYNTANLQSSDSHLGGITGCTVLGNLNYCYNIGELTTVGSYYGGIAGFSSSTLLSNYYLQGMATGGVNGANVLLQAEQKTQEELQIEDTYINWDFLNESVNGEEDYWDILSGLNNDYPFINMNYCVTFDMNGVNLEEIEKTGSLKGCTIPEDPSVDGYTFDSWNTQSDGNGVEFTEALEVTKSKTIYAIWQANDYTVIFNSNGGIGADITTTATYSEAIVLRENTFTKEGYTFIGWDLNTNAEIASYAEGSEYVMDIADTVVMYAIWGKNPTIEFLNSADEVTISTNCIGELEYGDNVTYFIVVKLDKEVLNIVVNGVAINKADIEDTLTNGYVFENMSGENTIEVTFVADEDNTLIYLIITITASVLLLIVLLVIYIRKKILFKRMVKVRLKHPDNYKQRVLKKPRKIKKIKLKNFELELTQERRDKLDDLKKKHKKRRDK